MVLQKSIRIAVAASRKSPKGSVGSVVNFHSVLTSSASKSVLALGR